MSTHSVVSQAQFGREVINRLSRPSEERHYSPPGTLKKSLVQFRLLHFQWDYHTFCA